MSDTVEGFSNYATFGVAVTLENDRKRVQPIWERSTRLQGDRHPNVKKGIWTAEEAERFEFADFLKYYTEREAERGVVSSDAGLVASQMVQAGLAEVNWVELADHFLAS